MALAAIAALLAARTTPPLTTPPSIKLSGGGELLCTESGSVTTACLGIPYGAAERWKRPTMHEIVGTHNATAFGPGCPGSGATDTSENCLFLNVYAPTGGSPMTLAPVMVWIHGGAYSGGNTHGFDGTPHVEAAKGDFVWVTIEYLLQTIQNYGLCNFRLDSLVHEINPSSYIFVLRNRYRLNVFGFLGSDALKSRDTQGSTGNYGLQDQRLALEWVQKNIAAFGGDKNNVMIDGCSGKRL